jgi:hypothetical protein
MTPLQEWFAFQTPGLIPGPDACLERFEWHVRELDEQIPQPTGFASSMDRMQRRTCLFSVAVHYAMLEARLRGQAYDDLFGWLVDWTGLEEIIPTRHAAPRWRGRDLRSGRPSGAGLGQVDSQRLAGAIRQAVLQLGVLDDAPPLELAGTRAQLLRHLASLGDRRFELRHRDRLTQVWEIDPFGTPLWLLTVRHPALRRQ